jgi:hypothetical protein
MLPSEVNNLQIKDTFEFDKKGNGIALQVYTLERRINTRVAQLRELGAIPQK